MLPGAKCQEVKDNTGVMTMDKYKWTNPWPPKSLVRHTSCLSAGTFYKAGWQHLCLWRGLDVGKGRRAEGKAVVVRTASTQTSNPLNLGRSVNPCKLRFKFWPWLWVWSLRETISLKWTWVFSVSIENDNNHNCPFELSGRFSESAHPQNWWLFYCLWD